MTLIYMSRRTRRLTLLNCLAPLVQIAGKSNRHRHEHLTFKPFVKQEYCAKEIDFRFVSHGLESAPISVALASFSCA
jgi:hypothetical protein